MLYSTPDWPHIPVACPEIFPGVLERPAEIVLHDCALVVPQALVVDTHTDELAGTIAGKVITQEVPLGARMAPATEHDQL